MKKPSLRVLVFITMALVALSGIFVGPNVSPAHAQKKAPDQVFAPYQDITINTLSLQSVVRRTGQKSFTFAFITNGGGTCNAEWAGVQLNQTQTAFPHLDSDIRAVQRAGGDAIISFGGAAGQELALTCQDPVSLQAQYQRVINRYHATRLDFDIEGGTEGDFTSYNRRNIALAALQRANPGLVISFTLPAATFGLLDTSIGLLNNAKMHGVHFSIVNIMPFDFGPPDNMMGQEAINSANGFFQQLQQIFPHESARHLWSMIGMTLLIGQNDSPGEIFSVQNGRQVLNFAKQQHIGFLAFWEVSRDNGSCPGDTNDENTCSGLNQSTFAFVNMFKHFGEDAD